MPTKYKGTLYRSRWDSSTWGMVALTAIFCIMPFIFDDDGWLPLAVCGAVLIAVIVILRSVYYRIDGRELIVYQLFIPKAYPIDKISEITVSKSLLSAPATSLTHRIAISFSDRSVMKSISPLVISPAGLDDFLTRLKEINPAINLNL